MDVFNLITTFHNSELCSIGINVPVPENAWIELSLRKWKAQNPQIVSQNDSLYLVLDNKEVVYQYINNTIYGLKKYENTIEKYLKSIITREIWDYYEIPAKLFYDTASYNRFKKLLKEKFGIEKIIPSFNGPEENLTLLILASPLSRLESIDFDLNEHDLGYYYPHFNLLVTSQVGCGKTNFIKKLAVLFEHFKPKTLPRNQRNAFFLKHQLTSSIKNSLKAEQNNLQQIQKSINSILKDLARTEKEATESQQKIFYYEETLKKAEKINVLPRIIKAKKLAFVENVKVLHDGISITYKPTYFTVRNFTRGGDYFGRRDIYLGRLTFTITKNGNFNVSSDYPTIEGNPHPHASSTGHPCFGQGDGAKIIYKLAKELEIDKLAWYLWQWIKTVRDSGAYVKSYQFYFDRLRQGLPVWEVKDGKNILIKLNEKARIESGEQMKLKKAEIYSTNIKNKSLKIKPKL